MRCSGAFFSIFFTYAQLVFNLVISDIHRRNFSANLALDIFNLTQFLFILHVTFFC